ncbi:MAG: hypothetical protein BWX99_01032 [Deltaproteobacteria bacterium ADurb.Bin151]|nr:MAG: hypothetical protein BWX99_01032 [Deltaproteobacteria bacterium ADurb.Bin151]
MLNGNAAAGRAAQLSGFEFFAFGDASADIKNDGAQLGAHRNFHQTDVVDVAGESEDLGALTFFRADRGVPFGSAQNDLADIGQRFNIVQNTWFLPQAGHGREGRTGSGHAAFSFN